MPKHLPYALLAGLLASGLFLVVFGIGLGFVFMFIPCLPLFLLGLSPKGPLTYIAVCTATVIITLVAGVASGALFLILLGAPAWYFSKKALLSNTLGSSARSWYPVGRIITNMALSASCLIAFMTWYYSHQDGGLPQLLSENIRDTFSELEPEYGDIINRMANGLSFLIFPITIWLWGILLYIHAWLANLWLVKNGRQVRQNLAVGIFIIPSWMLSLLAICALASLIGSPSMSFLGKATLMILMLPYFFLGCTLMHSYCKKWASSRFLIFFVYFLAFTQFWPVLILAGIGLWHQIKHLSASGTWFKN